MQDMNGGADEDTEMQKQLLDELMEFARGGMKKDMRQRYGKRMDDAGAVDEETPEDPEIPGVEASEGDLPPNGDEEGGGLDQEKLRAMLAAMKAKGGAQV